jgi:AcrR family transcriptional regulator
MATAAQPGLRELKKEQTRHAIADTALRLFGERGFEAVPVAEVAREANVSEATVFNYFPTKEDLVYHRMEAFEKELIDSVRNRAAGESALAAFGRFMLEPRGYLAAKEPDERFLAIPRMIEASPALLARERQIFERFTLALAEQLAADTGAQPDAIEPRVVAETLIGVHRALVQHARRGMLAGRKPQALSRDVRERGRRAVALLESGLGDYAVRRG